MSGQTIILRDLAEKAASHPRIEAAVNKALRAELPSVIEEILREAYPGETLRMYIPKNNTSQRRERDNAIRASWNGHNAPVLAKQFKLSTKQIMRIATGKA